MDAAGASMAPLRGGLVRQTIDPPPDAMRRAWEALKGPFPARKNGRKRNGIRDENRRRSG
jgi:hypothetical protein